MRGVDGNWKSPKSSGSVIEDTDYKAWKVDSSTPDPDILDHPVWQSNKAEIQPTADITNSESVAFMQDWIVFFSIGLGIGSGLLASLFYDFIRTQAPQGDKDQENTRLTEVLAQGNLSPAAGSMRLRRWFFRVGIFSLVAWAYRNYRRNKS